MKISKVIILGLLTTFLILTASHILASRAGYLPKPKLSIYEALRIAEDHLAAQKVDVSKHFIYSVTLHISGFTHNVLPKEDKDAWAVEWSPFAPSNSPYDSYYVVVYMDKSAKHFGTK